MWPLYYWVYANFKDRLGLRADAVRSHQFRPGVPKGNSSAVYQVIRTSLPKCFVVRFSEIPVSKSINAAKRSAKS